MPIKPEDQATIYEVAEAAGVSIATVSRVMNHPEKVALPTRERVLQAVSRLGFVPSIEGLSRSRSRFKRIGTLMPFPWTYSYSHRMQGVSQALPPRDFEIITYAVDDPGQLENYLTMLSTGDRVDGLIVFSLPVEHSCLKQFRRRGIPVVLVEQEQEGAFSIVGDNYFGGALAAEHLLEMGYHRPAFLGEGGLPDHITNSAESRFAGFRDTFAEGGIVIPRNRVEFHFHGASHTLLAARRLLEEQPGPDAIFAASDWEALILLKELRDRGIAVPEDIALIGYDNIEAARLSDVTSIDQHLQESGRLAGEIIRDYLQGTLSDHREMTRLEPVLCRGRTT